MANKSNEEHNREKSKLYFDYFKHLTTITTASAAAELTLSQYLQLSVTAVSVGLVVLVLNLLLSILGMIFVPIFADTWGSTFPKGSSLLKSLMICTAVLFFDGIAIFAFYAKLNPRLAGLLTCFLVLITGLLTWLLSRFSTEGYLKPTRPYAFSLIIFVLIGFSVLVLYILYAMFGQTIELTQGLGLLTALFAVITGLVGTYFGVKVSSDASERVQELAQSAGGNTTPPTLLSVSPPNGAVDVDGNTDVTVTFSTNMNPATITPDTLRLESLREANPILVPGAVRYDPQILKATLTPDAKPLQPGLYQGTVTTAVRDQMGRALAQPYTWQLLIRP